jgi:hypothetical protein
MSWWILAIQVYLIYKVRDIAGGGSSFGKMVISISNTQKMDKAQHNIYLKNQPLSQMCGESLHASRIRYLYLYFIKY